MVRQLGCNFKPVLMIEAYIRRVGSSDRWQSSSSSCSSSSSSSKVVHARNSQRSCAVVVYIQYVFFILNGYGSNGRCVASLQPVAVRYCNLNQRRFWSFQVIVRPVKKGIVWLSEPHEVRARLEFNVKISWLTDLSAILRVRILSWGSAWANVHIRSRSGALSPRFCPIYSH